MNEQKLQTDFARTYPEVKSKKDPMYHVLMDHFRVAYTAGWEAGQSHQKSRKPMRDRTVRQ